MKYQKEYTIQVKEIIKEAGSNLKKMYYGSLDINEKSPKDYITNADIKINNFLIEKLTAIYEIDIYSEEKSESKIKSQQWIIDPVDGTSNFILGIPHFAISIAYKEDSKIIAGFVYNPMTDELFWTDPWNSAYLNEDIIKVSSRTAMKEMYGLFGFSANIKNINKYYQDWTELFTNCKKALGVLSPSLSICCVAKGKADYFIDFGCSIEGHVAASEILRKSGGQLYNYDGETYDISTTGIVATNNNSFF
ncbi:MAG: inositol monophosphatase family protein [bacterium]